MFCSGMWMRKNEVAAMLWASRNERTTNALSEPPESATTENNKWFIAYGLMGRAGTTQEHNNVLWTWWIDLATLLDEQQLRYISPVKDIPWTVSRLSHKLLPVFIMCINFHRLSYTCRSIRKKEMPILSWTCLKFSELKYHSVRHHN